MLLRLTLLLLLMFFSVKSYSQTGTGCLLKGKLYNSYIGTTLLGLPLSLFKNVYDENVMLSPLSGACPGSGWYTTTSLSNKCGIGSTSILGLINVDVSGQEVTYNFVECDLDDYAYVLVLSFGGLGFFLIKRLKYC